MALSLPRNHPPAPPFFTHYQGFQGYFYTEILTKLSKLSQDVIQRVSLVDLQEGKARFKKFAENGYKWNKDDYDHNGFRAVYCEKLFITRAEIVYDVLFIYESLRLLPHLVFDTYGRARSLKVASLGCGPSGELAGLEAYITDLKIRHINGLQMERHMLGETRYSAIFQTIQMAKLGTVTGYDSSEGWREYTQSLGYTFIHQHVDQSFIERMEPLDILILSYFAHNAGFSRPLEPRCYNWMIHDYMRNWDILLQKVKMIIVVDTSASSRETHEQLTKRGFGGIDGKRDSEGRLVTVKVWFRPDLWV